MDTRLIRAARSLLDWTQEDLAKASKLSLPAIANIERGSSKPRADSVETIKKAFESNGIEFLQPTGVQLVSDRFDIQNFVGQNSLYSLWNDVYNTLSEGGELLLSGITDRYLVDNYPEKEIFSYLIEKQKLKIQTRVLICEGDNEIIGDNPSLYRQVPEILFSQIPHYIYENKVAIFQTSVPRIIIIENKNVAETFKNQFEHNWSISKKLDSFKSLLR